MKVFTRISLSIALVSIGLGIGILFVIGARRPEVGYLPTYSVEDTVEEVKSLDIYVDYGEIVISQGDEFSVEARNLYKQDDLKSYVKDGVWTISHDSDESINLFGFRLPISIGIGRVRNSPSIKITVPQGFYADDVRITLNAGRLKADNIQSSRGRFTVDAGSLEIDGIIIKDESTYSVGAGQINLKNVDISNINVECNVGSVVIEGLVSGDNRLYCNVGRIDMDLKDKMGFYSFDIDSDIGNVIINGKSYGNGIISVDSNMKKGGFLLNVDVGNISMDFR